jgi:uncharacterized protein YegP (UPF0339 family)
VGMDWLLSVFEHFAKFNSISVHKTYSPLGQVRHDKNHNTLEVKGLSFLLFPFGTRFAFSNCEVLYGGSIYLSRSNAKKSEQLLLKKSKHEKNRSNHQTVQTGRSTGRAGGSRR